MATPFETAILKMRELGLFQFMFPFMLTSAIFYGLLRKAQIFGEPEKNVAVNAVVALIAAFMVWASPIIAGIDIEVQLITFFVHGLSAIVVIMLGLLVAGMFFPPNLPEVLDKKFEKGGFWIALLIFGILIGAGILIPSGLINVFLPAGVAMPEITSDIFITIGVILLLVITVLAIVSLGR